MRVNGLTEYLKQTAQLLRDGKLVVFRTDTLYGIVALADDKAAVQNLQQVRHREPGKAFIVLIPDSAAAYGDDGERVAAEYEVADRTRPTSVIIEHSTAPEYLLHHDGSVAYRVPLDARVQALLALTGPLVAPSANPAGEIPARSVTQAEAYFGQNVTLYVDDGETPIEQQPSAVIRITETGEITQLR